MRYPILLSLLILFISCQPTPDPLKEFQSLQISQGRKNNPSSLNKPYVIMVSLDGFRHDYASRFGATNLLEMAENGFSVEQLTPSYPTKTFPNHYSLVTGMYPSSHGLVSNEYYNPTKGEYYKIGNREAVEDGTWYDGTPLWVLAEKQGMLSGSFFWVGSEADIQETYPTYHYKYDGSIPNDMRVKQVLKWLSLPETERPHFITLYFSLTDDVGHKHGPDSKEIEVAVKEIDGVIGELRSGIAAMDLPVHLLVTSDHGMVSAPEIVKLDSVDFGDSKVSWSMPLMVYQQDSSEVERIYQELSQVDHLTTCRKSEIPAELNFSKHSNIGEIIALTQPPFVISQRNSTSQATHGFDPATVPEMKTILFAEGPKIKKESLEEARNIDVFPLVVELLGLEMPEHPIDGSNTIRDAALK
ncbi:MAG: ectonucleotide pyrophosphatase/phosphodiesterase [Cyclobacteriaceae bacterium]